MKIILLGLLLLLGWKAGFILLMTGAIAGVLILREGARTFEGGDVEGKKKIVAGFGLATSMTLLLAAFNAGWLFLTWLCLSVVFPELQSSIREALAALGLL